MSGQIKLRPEEARANANDVRSTQADATELINALRSRMNSLVDSFEGRTQEAFLTKLDEVGAGLRDLLNGLDQLGHFLSSAADAIVELDSSLASQLI